MSWNKRTLVYGEPINNPTDFLQSIDRTNSHILINSSKNITNFISSQIKYSINDFSDVINDKLLVKLLKNVQIFQMTLKRNDFKFNNYNDKFGYLNEWFSWMYPGISLNVAPQNVNSWREYYDLSVFTRDILLGDQLKIKVSDLPDMIFEKQWWSWSQLNRDINNNFNDGIKHLLKKFGINDNNFDNFQFDAIEILLNKDNLEIYIYNYYSDNLNLSIEINSFAKNHEFAIVTEMSSIKEIRNEEINNNLLNPSRFLNGIKGSNIEEKFQPIMFLHNPSYYILPFNEFNLEFNQISNGWIHPLLEFRIKSNIDNVYKNNLFPNDNDILDKNKCQLHAEIEFSNEFIIDKYEINRIIEHEKESFNNNNKCIKKINSISNNGMDLELPTYKVEEWGSYLDLIIDHNCVLNNNNQSFTLPLHLRYPKPGNNEGGMTQLESPWSKVYWECPLNQEATKNINDSFYFEPNRFTSLTSKPNIREYFYSIPNNLYDNDKSIKIDMPRGDGRLREDVENMTGLIVAICSALIIFVSIFKH